MSDDLQTAGEQLAGEIKELSRQYYRGVLLKDPQLETCIAPVHVSCAIVGYKHLQEAQVQIRSDATVIAREYKFVVSVHSQGEVSRTGVLALATSRRLASLRSSCAGAGIA